MVDQYMIQSKTWGYLRTIFSTSGYRNPEVENIFVNISAKTTCFRNISGYYSREQELMIHEKNQSSKISYYFPLKRLTIPTGWFSGYLLINFATKHFALYQIQTSDFQVYKAQFKFNLRGLMLILNFKRLSCNFMTF